MELEADLATILKSGQTVEITTSRFVKPNPNWLDMVITSKAKTSIKAQLRENSKVELSKLGKHLISDALKYQKIDINDIPKEKWKECLKDLHCSNFHDLYIKVGLSEIFCCRCYQHIA